MPYEFANTIGCRGCASSVVHSMVTRDSSDLCRTGSGGNPLTERNRWSDGVSVTQNFFPGRLLPHAERLV